MKYKVGDTVRVIVGNRWRNVGEIGVIDSVLGFSDSSYPYIVEFQTADYEDENYLDFKENEIELINNNGENK
jgi:hypothetical protein